MTKCGYHGNNTSANQNMVVFGSSPQVAYLHTKNEGGLKIFISKFASLSQRTVLKQFTMNEDYFADAPM